MSSVGSSDISDLAEAIASRIRLIQVDFADDTPEKRQAFLADEIERALGDQTPARRRALLSELLERFPTWNAQMLSSESSDGGKDEIANSGVSALLDRLIELAPNMTSEDRLTVTTRLEEAGVITRQTRDGWSLNTEDAVTDKLGFDKNVPLDPERVLQLFAEQSALITQLEKIVQATWRELAPRGSAISADGDLAKMFERFATGDDDISRSQVGEELERTRQLTAAMIAAIGRLGRVLAENLAKQYSPAVLEQAARQDKRWHEGVEIAAWRLFKERAEGLDETELDREVRRLLVEYTESVARGLR